MKMPSQNKDRGREFLLQVVVRKELPSQAVELRIHSNLRARATRPSISRTFVVPAGCSTLQPVAEIRDAQTLQRSESRQVLPDCASTVSVRGPLARYHRCSKGPDRAAA